MDDTVALTPFTYLTRDNNKGIVCNTNWLSLIGFISIICILLNMFLFIFTSVETFTSSNTSVVVKSLKDSFS